MRWFQWFLVLCPVCAWAQINYDTLSENSWMQMRPTGLFPSRGGDVLAAIDTAGNFYMIGGCTYGNGAGGTHNNDIVRVDLTTGASAMLANCGNNVWGWAGGCQAGHAYDAARNCVWITGGAAAVCSGQNGLWKFQCPDGPFTRIADDAGGKFLIYDPLSDRLFKVDQYKLNIFDCATSQWLPSSNYPFSKGWEINTWEVACCYDSKRAKVVITMNNPIPNGETRNDFYSYDPATGEWETRVPPEKPPFNCGNLGYDPVHDLFTYFGGATCPSQLWVYNYDANTWTRMPDSGKAYSEAAPASSTWPPYRIQNTWNYSPRHGVFFTWGTTEWMSDSAKAVCLDDGVTMPFWVYKADAQYAGKEPLTLGAGSNGMALKAGPNPSAGPVAIRFRLERTSAVKLAVYDLRGRLVAALAGGKREKGTHVVTWKGLATAGLYVVRLEAGEKVMAKPVLFVK